MVELKIRAVLFQEEGWWVAQCLEHDIAVQAKDEFDLLYELERALIGRFLVGTQKGAPPFEGLPEAPPRYWTMYKQAQEDGLPSVLVAELRSMTSEDLAWAEAAIDDYLQREGKPPSS